MRHTTNREQHSYMALRRRQNLAASASNPAELWAWERLRRTDFACQRQQVVGCRVFDFYYPAKRIAVEIDGRQHQQARAYDEHRDDYNALRSGIITIRIRAFDRNGLENALVFVRAAPKWKARKTSNTDRKKAVVQYGMKLAHGRWKPPRLV